MQDFETLTMFATWPHRRTVFYASDGSEAREHYVDIRLLNYEPYRKRRNI